MRERGREGEREKYFEIIVHIYRQRLMYMYMYINRYGERCKERKS